MRDRFLSGKTRIVIVLIGFVAILALVGLLMKGKMQSLLHNHIERQVTTQAGTLAELVNGKLQTEITNLENIAFYLQDNPDDLQEIMEMAQTEDIEAVWGIMDIDRHAVYGSEITAADFAGIQNSFRGNNAVSYKEGSGLLFTVPVYNNGNIKYVLYKFVEEALLFEKFGVVCYDGNGRTLVADREENIVIPDGNRESGYVFWQDPAAGEIFKLISDKMNIASEAAAFCPADENAMYLFVAEVGELDLLLVGMVPEGIAAEGVSYIITLVLWVFGLLLLLLAIGMTFVFGAEEKAKESEELRRAKMIADMANQAKTNFLASMSHEIRTPINAIMGMNEMILRESEDEVMKEYAFNIQSASRTLLSLINDILDLSKIEAGKMEIVEDDYRLSVVLNDVVNMVQVKTEQKNLAFHIEVEQSLPDKLFGDEVRIRQVLVNVLNNAVKYTKEGSVDLLVQGERTPDGMVILQFAVTDTGIGIRAEDMDKLFGDFERLDQKENHNVEGTGLGLSITTKMLDLMSGRLEVKSVYGEGSTFTIYLPQKVMGTECVGHFETIYREHLQSMQTCKESFEAPQAKVLVVDDNEMNLFVVKNLLKKTKINITCCDSGEKCLEITKKEAFDVILLDHMMPGMDGIETMKCLKSMEDNCCKNIPVIVLTANAIVGVREMYLAEGFDDYLSKPIESERLEELLKKYIPADKIIPVSATQTPETMRRKEEPLQTESTTQKQEQETQEKLMRGAIDIFLGLQYSAESKEMYYEFLRMFCDMKPEKKQKMEELFAQKDWENYAIAVHALKSTSLSIGAKKLSETALALEKAGKEQQEAFILEHHEAAMQLYDVTVKEGYQILSSEICGY